MTTDTLDPLVPPMHSEAGYEPEDSAPPLRVSGYICLIFGVLSFFSTLGQPLLVFPVLAFLFGMFALRRFGDQTPHGIRPALVGMVLAAGFGSCGLFVPWMKSASLGRQAEHFSRQYMEVVARVYDEFAMELRKDYVNRFPSTMPLEQHYRMSDTASENLAEFTADGVNVLLRKRGPNAEWVLDQPTRVYYSYNRQHAEVVWRDPEGKSKVQFFLEYRPHHQTGDGEWHVHIAQFKTERIVAPSVL